MTAELRSDGLIRLRIRPGGVMAWTIPAWATLCGAIASGELTPTLSAGLQLLLTLLLVEAGWGTVWSALATTNWAMPLRRWRNWRIGDPPRLLPYTQPGSPGYRLAHWLSQLQSWYRAVLVPTAGPAIGAIVAGLAISLILAAVAGLELTMLTLAVCAVMQLAIALDKGRGQPSAGWGAVLRLGLPWLAGHLTFTSLTLPSLALAAAFSLAVTGTDTARQGWGRALWTVGQLIAAALFILLRHPLVVLFLTLLLFPQWLLAIRPSPANPHRWIRRAWPWLTAAMLLAAWTL